MLLRKDILLKHKRKYHYLDTMAKQVIPYLIHHALLPCVMKGKKIDKSRYQQY